MQKPGLFQRRAFVYQNNWNTNYFVESEIVSDVSMSSRIRLGMRLSTVARHWRAALDERLRDFDFSDATWAPLFHLVRHGDGVTQTELADRMRLDTSSLVRLLDILEKAGQIERQPDPGDRRAKRIHITPSGRAAVARLEPPLTRFEAGILEDVADEEIAVVLSVLDRVEARLRRLQER